MKKRLIALLSVAAASSLCLCACAGKDYVPSGKSDPFAFQGNMVKPEIVIDGKADDALWQGDDVAHLHFSSCDVSILRRPNAIYAFYKVSDTTPYTYFGDGNADEVTHSDSVEFHVNVNVDTRTNTKQAGCYLINLGRDGRTRIMSASNGTWYAWAGMYTFETREGSLLQGDEDYYYIEMMLPVAQLGIGATEDVGIALGHVDRFSPDSHDLPENFSWNGQSYKGSSVDPQISSSYLVLRASGGDLMSYAEYDVWKAQQH